MLHCAPQLLSGVMDRGLAELPFTPSPLLPSYHTAWGWWEATFYAIASLHTLEYGMGLVGQMPCGVTFSSMASLALLEYGMGLMGQRSCLLRHRVPSHPRLCHGLVAQRPCGAICYSIATLHTLQCGTDWCYHVN